MSCIFTTQITDQIKYQSNFKFVKHISHPKKLKDRGNGQTEARSGLSNRGAKRVRGDAHQLHCLQKHPRKRKKHPPTTTLPPSPTPPTSC